MEKRGNWKAQSLNLIINGMIAYLVYNFTNTVALNVYVPAIAELKGIEASTLLYWNTIGSLVAVVASLIVGKISGKIGLKRLTVIGFILQGLSFMLIPLVPGVICGVFVGFNQVASIIYCQLVVGARVGNWYPKRKGEILGIVTAILILSSLVLLPLFNNMIVSMGVRNAMVIFGVAFLIWGIVSIFLVKDNPEDVGLYPENMSAEEAAAMKVTKADTQKSNWSYGNLLKNGHFLASAIGWGLNLMALVGVASVIVAVLLSKGMTMDQAVAIAAFAGVMQMIGSVVSGFIDTRISTKAVITIFMIMAAIACVILGLAPAGAVVMLIIGYYLLMIMSGAPNNLMPSQYLSLSGGGVDFMLFNGLALAIASILRAFGTSIMAFCNDHLGGYNVALLIFAAGSVVAMILIRAGGFQKIEKE